jgi:hypothetical protein
MKSISFVLILFLILSCRNLVENSVKDGMFRIDIDNCNVLVDLKLSDLFDSCSLVQLETTKECLVDQYISNLFISDKYIIINDRNGVYKFSSDGKFIRKIINVGRGPQEISNSINCYYDERNNLLYFDEGGLRNNFIYVYDIESESYLEPIKKCFPETWGDFIICNDSLIIGSIAPGIWGSLDNIKKADTIPYAFFIQNFKGEFLSGIPSNKRYEDFQTVFIQRAGIITGDKEIHYKYNFDDTLFKLRDGKLLPYLITIFDKHNINPPSDIPKIEEKRSYFSRFENSSFLIFKNATFKGMVPFKDRAMKAVYKNVYFFLNKTNGKYGLIKSYTDDFIGKIQSSENEDMPFPLVLPNDKIYVLYYPSEVLQKAANYPENIGLPKNIYIELDKIKNNITETDNPVLLIGLTKKKLQILR